MRLKLAVCVAVTAVMMVGTAMAESVTVTQGSYSATLNYDTTSATLTFGGLNGLYTDQVAIHISNTGSVTGGVASAGTWTFQSGNNSVNCDGTGEWFCAVATSPVLFDGLSLTWLYSGVTLIDPVSIQFAVCTAGSACGPGTSNFVTNFSQSGSPTTSTPEPASLALLGAGLLGLGGLARRRKR